MIIFEGRRSLSLMRIHCQVLTRIKKFTIKTHIVVVCRYLWNKLWNSIFFVEFQFNSFDSRWGVEHNVDITRE